MNERDEEHREDETGVEPEPDDYAEEPPSQSEPSAASPGPDAVAVMPDEVTDEELATEVLDFAEPFESIGGADVDGFLRRASGARVVLMGASTHGTSEFYRMRSRLTRELVSVHGFDFVALEADWGDAARIDRYVRDGDVPESEWTAFAHFPRWLWRNTETREMVESLRDFNGGIGERSERVAFHGLDLFGMNASVEKILAYLGGVDPEAAAEARARYSCLAPWQDEPGRFAGEMTRETFEECEDAVVAELRDLLRKRLDLPGVSEDFVEAVQNARIVADAERYYRLLYQGGPGAWNVRAKHMLDTLRILLAHHGPDARGVVWAHNTLAGDASATSMGREGRTSLGELARVELDKRAYLLGMVTDRGRVTTASRWDGPAESREMRPAREDSWEHLLTRMETPRALLPIHHRAPPAVKERLADSRPQRTVGVVNDPDEHGGEYVQASLSRQFDEVVWFEESGPVTPLDSEQIEGEPDTYPFGV